MKKCQIRICVFFFYLLFPVILFSQSRPSITGTVTDRESGEPLMFANVYLANTFTGTTTNENGEYKLYNVEPGNYKLIVSYIGYESQSRNIRISAAREYKYLFRLGRDPLQASEVVVEAEKPKEWKKNLKRFEKYFFEYSSFARDCKLRNPFVLNFVYDKRKKLFWASAEDLLIIENHALGYIIKYMLQDFTVLDDRIKYWGEPYFELMIPENDEQESKWKKNRDKAYQGSLRHFLSTLVHSTTAEEGFFLRRKDAIPPDNVLDVPVKDPAELYTKKSESLFELSFDDYLEVEYRPGRTLKKVRKYTTEGTEFSSYVGEFPTSYLILKQNPVLFDTLGMLQDPFKSIPFGSWLHYRIGELLPREYKPGGVW